MSTSRIGNTNTTTYTFLIRGERGLINKIILLGRLGKDVETRTTQSGTLVASFSIAVDRRFKKDGETECDWFNCTCFGKQAEFAEKYLKKGTKVLISGSVNNDNYTNKEGQKVYSVQIIVEEIEFAESKNSGESKPKEGNNDNQWMNIPDGIVEELPFN